jgi:hypothetical protein
VKVLPQSWQIPRRIPIQSWYSSCACLRRRPWPIMESHLQNGHRRSRAFLSRAQSLSILSDGAESGIKTIALYRDSAPGLDPPRSEPEAGSLLLKKFQLEKNNASQLQQFQGSFLKIGRFFTVIRPCGAPLPRTSLVDHRSGFFAAFDRISDCSRIRFCRCDSIGSCQQMQIAARTALSRGTLEIGPPEFQMNFRLLEYM